MKVTLSLLILWFLGTPIMVVYMNHRSYERIIAQLPIEEPIPKQMVPIEVNDGELNTHIPIDQFTSK